MKSQGYKLEGGQWRFASSDELCSDRSWIYHPPPPPPPGFLAIANAPFLAARSSGDPPPAPVHAAPAPPAPPKLVNDRSSRSPRIRRATPRAASANNTLNVSDDDDKQTGAVLRSCSRVRLDKEIKQLHGEKQAVEAREKLLLDSIIGKLRNIENVANTVDKRLNVLIEKVGELNKGQ